MDPAMNPTNPSDENATLEGTSSPLPSSELPQPETPTAPSSSPKKASKLKKKGPRYKKPPSAAQGSSAGSNAANPGPTVKPNGKLSPGSTKNSLIEKPAYTAAQKKSMAKKGATYLQGASAFVAMKVVSDPDELQHGLFVMTEEEALNIATPAASILARHSVGAEVLGDTDLGDGISLGLAFVKYVSDNLKDRKILRESRAAHYAAQNVANTEEEVRSSPSATAQPDLIQATAEEAEAQPSQMDYLKKFLPSGLI